MMTYSNLNRWYFSILLAIPLAMLGCAKQDAEQPHTTTADDQADSEADPEDKTPLVEFDNFADGVAALKEHYQEIKTAFETSKLEDADDPLHGVGVVLEALPALAKTAGLAEDQLTAVEKAIDEMYTAYGDVDGQMHKSGKADYNAVSAKLDENLAVLEGAVPSK